jgi:hypothetical protein
VTTAMAARADLSLESMSSPPVGIVCDDAVLIAF